MNYGICDRRRRDARGYGRDREQIFDLAVPRGVARRVRRSRRSRQKTRVRPAGGLGDVREQESRGERSRGPWGRELGRVAGRGLLRTLFKDYSMEDLMADHEHQSCGFWYRQAQTRGRTGARIR